MTKPHGYDGDVARIERGVDIGAPAEVVWGLLQDVRRLPEFSPSTTRVLDAPARLCEVGQRYVQVGSLLGRELRSRWTVVGIEPGRCIRSEGDLGLGVRYSLTQRLVPLDAGRCRLTVTIDYVVPGGVFGRLAAKAGAQARAAREAQTVLDGIRRVAESTAVAAA